MKKIIVPIDFSEHSEFALNVAAQLAKKFNAELLVLHMLEMSENLLAEIDGLKDPKAVFLSKLTEQKFSDFLKKDYLKDIKITPIIKSFKIFSEVNDVASKHNADLIVMGSHGASGLKEMFVGSNTERVVRHAEIPVLVIKNKLEQLDFKDVVFACDFSEKSIKAYLNASKLFDKMGSKIHLVYVNLPFDAFKSSLEIERLVINFFTKADGHLDRMKDVHYMSDYSVEEGILNFATKKGAVLIAMPTQGRKGISHFFQGSVGEDVANHSHLPVITFKM